MHWACLFAGRFVDKVGTRIGYMVIMALWSLSAMGHALVNSVLQFGIARACLGIGESGNFPAANKTNAEWFPQKERSLLFRHLQLRRQCRRHSGYAHRALGDHSLRLALCLSGHRLLQRRRGSCCGTSSTASPPNIPRCPQPNCAYINQEPAEKMGPSNAVGQVAWAIRQTWALCHPQISHRSHLVVLSLLAARVTSATSFIWASSVWGLPILIVYNASAIGSIYGGYLPASFIRMGLSAAARAAGGHASLRLPRGSRFSHQLSQRTTSEMGRYRIAQPGGSRAPGLVGQSLHHGLGYVPAQRRGLGHRHRRHGRSGRRLSVCQLCRSHSASLRTAIRILFIIAASVYLVSLLIMVLLAPGLKKVESVA